MGAGCGFFGYRCRRSVVGRLCGSVTCRRTIRTGGRRAGFQRLAVHELADQVLKHNGGLGVGDLVTGFPVGVAVASLDADVLVAEQPAGHDLERAVIGEMVAIVHVERDGGLVGLVVEVDALDAADDHAGALDGRLGLEAANVLELGLHLVTTATTEAEQIAGLQGQEQ